MWPVRVRNLDLRRARPDAVSDAQALSAFAVPAVHADGSPWPSRAAVAKTREAGFGKSIVAGTGQKVTAR
ncbi:hypothetical protein [Streptomyces sp. NBC_00258]|uniref:hypothetical protein n=1 Tax=Streptomyces sp. NBC_00258 TaxID=2903642 RepID=UPI002E2E6BF0|nr:hypothetical protein [Streptomyces sp. NBC_00258]